MSDIQDRIAEALADLSRKERAVKEAQNAVDSIVADATRALQEAQEASKEVSASVSEDLSAIKAKRADLAALLTAGNIDDIDDEELENTLAAFEPLTATNLDETISIPSNPPPAAGRKRSRASANIDTPPIAQADDVSGATKRSRASTRVSVARRERSDEEIDAELDAMPKYSFLSNCTIIVKVGDGDWRELACEACNGNFSAQTGTMLKGISAFITHLSKSHGYPASGFKRCIVQCSKRKVPQKELRAIYRNPAAVDQYITIRKLETEKGRQKAVKEKKEQEYTEDWRFVKDPKNYLANCSRVVRHPDGHWVEIHCPVCEGNYTSRGYLKNGVKGFWDHIHHAHGEDRMPGGPRAIIARCFVWDLSEMDVAGMRGIGGTAKMPLPKQVFSTKKKDQEMVDDEEETMEINGDGEDGGDLVDLTDERPLKRRRSTRKGGDGALEAEDEQEMAGLGDDDEQ